MFQLAAPLFALAAAAAVIPVFIHLIHKKRAPQLMFSTLRFLRVSSEKTAHRKRIQDLLLLLLRAAALALLALALMQPVMSETAALFGSQRSLSVVFIIDNSTSMGMSHAGTTRLESAKRIATGLIEKLREGDRAALVMTNGPPTGLDDRLYQKLENLRPVLDRCRPSAGKADFASAFDRAFSALEGTSSDSVEIYCLTDMQAVNWEGLADQLKQEDAERLRIPVVVVNVGRSDFENVALTECVVTSQGQVVGLPLSMTAKIQNQSDRPLRRHVDLYVDERKERTSAAIQLEPGEIKQLPPMTYVFRKAGAHYARLQIAEADSLADDNVAHFAANVAPKIDVCVCRPVVHEVPYLDEAFFISRALGVLGAVELAQITTEQLTGEDLSRYAVVICCNLGNLEDNQAAVLGRYLARGGKLLWFMGDQIDPEELSATSSAVPEAELLPVRLLVSIGDAEKREEAWPVEYLDATYEGLTGLAEPPSLYQGVKVYQYVKFAQREGADSRVLARLKGGDPFLVVATEGEGRTLAFSTSARRDWSNFPVRPLFAPLLNKLVFYLAEKTGESFNFAAGVEARFPFANIRQPVTLEITFTTEEGGSQTVQATSEVKEDGSNLARFDKTHRPGIYRARVVDGAPRREFCFAVNRDIEESAPETVVFEELQTGLPLAKLLYAGSAQDLQHVVDRLRKGWELWNVFLIAVLCVLVGEVYVGNRLKLHGKLAPEETATDRATARQALDHLSDLQEMEERRRRTG